MTRIGDLGDLYDKALKVLQECLEEDEDPGKVNTSAVRAATAMRIVDRYLLETAPKRWRAGNQSLIIRH